MSGALAPDDAHGATATAERPVDGEAVIALDHVSLAFERSVLTNVSLTVRPRETLALVGESGTGKSTILRLILRLLTPDAGRVLVHGENVGRLDFEEVLEVRRRMGMVFQGAALFDSLTVFENIAYPLREHTQLDDTAIEACVREKLAFVNLDPDEVMDQLPAELSGGMRKRVAIARAVVTDPPIVLYDEPTSGLDPLTTATITHLIRKLQRERDVTSVVVSHDLRSCFRIANRIALLADGGLCFIGTPQEMTESDDQYIRAFLGGT